ncbi:MAG: (d)CMP kinase [Clostridiales bacterium]|nr:(d)CMP kinase [Clostridiales bacterium]
MINIAIDGPAGAGKSSVAKAAAKQLGYIYVDTGALYRAIGVNALRHGFKTDDAEKIIPMLDNTKVELIYTDGIQRVILNGEDVSEEIRLPEASMAASNVSAIPEVRAFLLNLQRDIAKKNNVIMDGRDIGTVILPDAQYKFFLTASPEVRADRRYKELKEKGSDVDYNALLEEIIQRDYNDSHRETAPLKQAEDAIFIDTSNLSFDDSVEAVVSKIR